MPNALAHEPGLKKDFTASIFGLRTRYDIRSRQWNDLIMPRRFDQPNGRKQRQSATTLDR
jgi:hypothetical protein